MEPGSPWYRVLNNDDRVLDFFHAVLRIASSNVIEDTEKARPLMRLLFRADEKQSYTVDADILEKLGCTHDELRKLLESSPGGPRCERIPLPGAPAGARWAPAGACEGVVAAFVGADMADSRKNRGATPARGRGGASAEKKPAKRSVGEI